MKMNYTYLILLLVAACMVMPVSADTGNTTNTTGPSTNVTTVVTTTTIVVPTSATTTMVANTTTTAVPSANATTVPATTVMVTTTTQVPVATTGDLSVASSPLGAAILIDGRYYGVTPGNVTGLSPGSHIIRLSLSGYNDYEGTAYIVAGQSIPEYGTLHPINTGPSQIIVATVSAQPTTALPEPTIQPVVTQTASSDSPLSSPTVIAALIGILTAAIGAGATIFTHKAKVTDTKKEDEPKKE